MPLIPGVHANLSESYYFKDPALSASETIDLLSGMSPAKFIARRNKGGKRTAALEFGRLAHRIIIEGKAVEHEVRKPRKVEVLYHEPRSPNSNKLFWNTGEPLMLTGKLAQVARMKEALQAHPFAMAPFSHGGEPEVTLVWDDEATGVRCRARLDWRPPEGYQFFADYKTTLSLRAEDIDRAIERYRYHVRAAHYLDGIRACGLHPDPRYLIVFQEKEPPFEVEVVEIDPDDLIWGRIEMGWARAVFAQCQTTGVWPPSGAFKKWRRDGQWPAAGQDEVSRAGLPFWARRRREAEHEAAAFSTDFLRREAIRHQAPLDR
ncbi:MAG: PD-(D/E)XK nuclease-like domain-containing protein [Thalassobaculum sp.]